MRLMDATLTLVSVTSDTAVVECLPNLDKILPQETLCQENWLWDFSFVFTILLETA